MEFVESVNTNFPITFLVKAHTEFKQKVVIVGSLQQLGCWDISKGQELNTSDKAYPYWNSPLPFYLPVLSEFQFKCVKVTFSNEPVWQSLCLNRKYKVLKQDTISIQYGKTQDSKWSNQDQHDRYLDNQQGLSFKQLRKFCIIKQVNNNIIEKHIFNIEEQGIKHQPVNLVEINQFAINHLHLFKGLMYVDNSEVILKINKHHNHSLDICYDNKGNQIIQYDQLLRYKLILFRKSSLVEQYMKFIEMKGYTFWIQKGSLIVLNNYGLQVVTVSVSQIYQKSAKDNQKTCFDYKTIYRQYQSWIKHIENGYKLLFIKKYDKIDKQDMQGATFIYGNPNILNMNQSMKNKLRKISKLNKLYFLLTKTYSDELIKQLNDLSPLNMISLTTSTVITENQIFQLPSCSLSDIKELKQRFLAQKVFDLVYDTQYMITLWHKYPRMFSVQTPYYQQQLSRFRVKYNLKDNRIKIRGIDLNQVVRIVAGDSDKLILMGTDSILEQIKQQALDIEIIRTSLDQIYNLTNK